METSTKITLDNVINRAFCMIPMNIKTILIYAALVAAGAFGGYYYAKKY